MLQVLLARFKSQFWHHLPQLINWLILGLRLSR